MARFFCASRSSFVSKVVYKPGRLSVNFKGNPATYEYFFVPKAIFKHFEKAESFGQYYNESVKGKYPSRKVS